MAYVTNNGAVVTTADSVDTNNVVYLGGIAIRKSDGMMHVTSGLTAAQAAIVAAGGTSDFITDFHDALGQLTLTTIPGTTGGSTTGTSYVSVVSAGFPAGQRVDVLYIDNPGSNTTLNPSLANTGNGVWLYQTPATASSSNIVIDASGTGSTIYLNGVLQSSPTVTLYSGNFGHMYRLVSVEDGDSYDIWELNRQLHNQQFAPANGSTNTCTDCIGFAVLKPAGTIAGATLVFPPHPQDGDVFAFTTTQTITALTCTSGTNSRVGAPTTLVANTYATMRFNLADTTWYRVA